MLRREHADTARTAKLLFKASPVTLKYLLLLCFAVLFCMVCLQSRTKTVEFVFESKEKLLDLVGNEEKLEKALLSRVKRTPPEIPKLSAPREFSAPQNLPLATGRLESFRKPPRS